MCKETCVKMMCVTSNGVLALIKKATREIEAKTDTCLYKNETEKGYLHYNKNKNEMRLI